jgi:hypothetical protein
MDEARKLPKARRVPGGVRAIFLLLGATFACSAPRSAGAERVTQVEGGTRGEEQPSPPSGVPCSRLVSRLPEAIEVTWGYEEPCGDASYSVGDEPADRITAGNLIDIFGRTRDLVFCGGDDLTELLAWPHLRAGTSRARLRYETGAYTVYSGCTPERHRVSVEGGQLFVQIDGGPAFVVSSDLQLRESEPDLVHAHAARVPHRCNAHLVAAATREQAELCLSAYRPGTLATPNAAPPDVLYASFRSSCE